MESKMRRIVVFCGLINCFSAVYAQGEIDFQPKVFYRNEWSIAAMLNSNGFGFNYRYGQRIDAANKRLFEVDFAYMKDPKEQKSYGHNNTGAKYVDGKRNLAFDFRFGYGKQRELFRKHDLGGIAIRYFYNFGPSLVLLKPIYYDVGEWIPIPGTIYSQWEPSPPAKKYDSNWYNKNYRIGSRASFFKGFDELQPIPGAFAKFGFNFEFGKEDRIIHALEAGLIAEGFIKKVEIMDFTRPDDNLKKYAKNRQFFLTLFVSYRFGRIVDPYEVKKKRERTREISY
jgi:hypothetical protein